LIIGKFFKKRGDNKKSYYEAHMQFKNAYIRGFASEWLKIQLENQPNNLTLNYVILRELFKVGQSSKVVNHLRSVLVDNHDQCKDFRRAFAYTDQSDTDSKRSCQEWAREAERESR
jgi:hypothetical protein